MQSVPIYFHHCFQNVTAQIPLNKLPSDGHLQALDCTKESLIVDRAKEQETLLDIRGIAVLFGFKAEVCNPSFGTEEQITVGVMPLGGCRFGTKVAKAGWE